MNDAVRANTNISHYRIISKIGAGGMGEVYRARDERLDRDVAIKLLPPDVASDEDRLRRFKQEAKATSALNHPNILTVYDIGEHDGASFIVSELLEGEELRDRLNDGPIPLRKTIDYAQQIVSGLAAAHERGITHRDLKPENLFITKDDRVKILDFGLAKLRQHSPGVGQGSEDATKKALTDPGVVMGTVGYMSPEQVRGHAVDHRSDIFSFGAILYEMISGRRAFEGDSVVETMHAILKEDVPEFDGSAVRVPPAVDKLMHRCLEKKPDHRFHSAHDLGFALDAVASPTTSSGSGGLTITARSLEGAPESTRRTWVTWIPWGVAALLLITTVAFAAMYFNRSPDRGRDQTMRFTVPPPDNYSFTESFTLSPNGQLIAFAARDQTGTPTLWVRQFASIDARQLAGTEGAAFPFWSPDGRMIGFFAGGKLKKIDAAGGPTQTLADASSDPRGGAWASDGTIIFAPNVSSPLMRISSSGGTVSELTQLTPEIFSHRWPSMLPDGKHFLYFGRGNAVIEKQGIYIASLDSPEPTFVVPSSVSGYYTEEDGVGFLLYIHERTLMSQGLDISKRALTGNAEPVVQDVLSFPGEVGPTGYSAFAVAGGNLVYRTALQHATRLTWYERSGKQLEAITEPGGYHEPSLSRDGSKVLYGRDDSAGWQDIYLQDLVRGSNSRLTFDPASDTTAVFSPDETQVAFYSNRGGKNGIYRKSASGAGNDEALMIEPLAVYPNSWSPDGKYLIYDKVATASTKIDLWIVPMTGDSKPFPYLEGPFEEAHAHFSPDGRWVAYSSSESGRLEVYIQSFPAGNGKWQVSAGGGGQVQWRRDGKELYYIALDRNLMAVEITNGQTLGVGRPVPLFPTSVPLSGITDDRNNYVPSPDGKRFLVNSLIESTHVQPLTLVLNWARDIRR